MFDNLLESSLQYDSNKWSDTGCGEEITQVLCVSCPSANEFSAILFLLLPDQAQILLDHFYALDEL